MGIPGGKSVMHVLKVSTYRSGFVCAALLLLNAGGAFAATDDERIIGSDILDKHAAPSASFSLRTIDSFLKTRSVLNHFRIPEEADPQADLDRLAFQQSRSEISRRLPFLDLHSQFPRFFTTDQQAGQDGVLRGFQDRDSKEVKDFEVPLASSDDARLKDFEIRLAKAASSNPVERPLAGLRIALDPGHMGGDAWYRRTGKYVHDGKGRVIREGVIALQTALLLEEELTRLGAEVMLTRRTLDPVSELPYSEFSVAEFARKELQASTLQNWFLSLLGRHPDGPVLYRAFERSREIKALFSESRRSQYFILRADLDARAEKIAAFKPDISLVIHYDVLPSGGDGHGLSPKNLRRTKVYVPGAFMRDEFSTREARRDFTHHLLDRGAWSESVKLSHAIVRENERSLGLEPDPHGGSSATTRILPGVYSRNLSLTRRLTGHAMSYLEILFYNSPDEFAALSRTKHPMRIDGEDHPYSDRVLEVVRALRDGVVDFVRGRSLPPARKS